LDSVSISWQSSQVDYYCYFVLSCLSFVDYIHLATTDYWAAFFLMPSRFWELGAGVLTCLALSQRQLTMRWPSFDGGCTASALGRTSGQLVRPPGQSWSNDSRRCRDDFGIDFCWAE